jgi:hypothetical protein
MIMKKIIYFAIVAVIMVACGQSQEQKAEALIKESLKKSLYKPETYKPVETKVDSAYAPYDDPEFFEELAELGKMNSEFVELEEKAKHAKSSMSIWSGLYQCSFGRNESQEAKEEYDERVKYWEEDTTLTEEQRKEYKESITPWDYTMTVTKTFEDSTYVVFSDSEYSYLGGAHGGVFGFGALTFRFSDGSIVKGFLKDNVVKDMQPLLKKGLKEYFNEAGDEVIKTDKQLMENLQLSDDTKGLIPLPAWMPCPDEKGKGLAFIYQQYEIACYAVGMPNFVLTWDELKPFLREDILEDLKK